MKHQAVFSLKDKSKKKCRLLQFLFGTLRVKTIHSFIAHLSTTPEHEVLMVSYCDQSLSVVRVLSTFCFKQLLLQNGLTDFEIILQEGSFGDPLPKLLRLFRSVEQNGPQS